MIISLFNQKGGVGKTTTTINLSSCLAEKGRKILLVDMDPQANSTSGVGIQKHIEEQNIYDLLTSKQFNKEKILEVIQETSYDNLYILRSHIRLANAEIALANAMSRETILKRILDHVEDLFDYVIIDCPPSLGLLSINSLVASEKIIVAVEASQFAIEGISDLLDTVNLVREHLKPNLDILGVLMTKYDSRTNIAKDMRKKLINVFGDKIFKTVVRDNVQVKYAQGEQKPINHYNRQCHAFDDYMKLAAEVIKNE